MVALTLRAQIVADRPSTPRGRTGRLLAIDAANATVAYARLRLQALNAYVAGTRGRAFLALATRVAEKRNEARTLIRRARLYLSA